MAELSTDDVVAFTGGRLADDDETQRMLNVALRVAREHCGWHVTPVRVDDEITVNGPGGTELFPPTRKIVTLTSITNDGVDVPTTDVIVPAQSPYKIVRLTGTWSRKINGVTVTMDHGFTELEAADWRHAVLQMVDQMGATSGRSDADLIEKSVSNVTYRWEPLAQEALYSVQSILDSRYELRPVFLA